MPSEWCDLFLKVYSMNFERHWDIRGDNNRGWIDHRVKAFIDGIEVGHLTISYIPKDRFARHYEYGPVSYAIHISGACVGDGPSVKWVANLHWHVFKNLGSWNEANEVQRTINEMSFEEAMNFFYKTLVPVYEKVYGQKFLEHKEYWVDYPIVAYSYVEKEYRRKGIGTALYIEGAKWMQENGMTLYSSTLCSGNAEEFWNGLLSKGIAKPSKRRQVDRSCNYEAYCPRYEIDLENV